MGILVNNNKQKGSTLVRVSITEIKDHNQCQLGEEKVYFILYFVVYPPEMSGQKLEAGTDAEDMEEHCLLAFSA